MTLAAHFTKLVRATGACDNNVESVGEQKEAAKDLFESRKPYWEFEDPLVKEDRAAEQARIAK